MQYLSVAIAALLTSTNGLSINRLHYQPRNMGYGLAQQDNAGSSVNSIQGLMEVPTPKMYHNGALYTMPLEVDNEGRAFVQMNHMPLCDDTNGVVGVDCIYTAAITDGYYPAKLSAPVNAPNGDYARDARKRNPNYVQKKKSSIFNVMEEVDSPF